MGKIFTILANGAEFGVILSRIALWTTILMVIFFGLFTFPIIMVSGLILVCIVFSYIHRRD